MKRRGMPSKEWWKDDGTRLLEEIAEAAESKTSGRKYNKDETAGRVLTFKDCRKISKDTKVWPKLVAAVEDDDLPSAQRYLSKPSDVGYLLRRGMIGIHSAETLTVSAKEAAKGAVYDTLNELNAMIGKAIQSKIAHIFPLRKSTTLAFAESVRSALAPIEGASKATDKALALLVGCEESQLKKNKYAALQPAVHAVGEI